MPSSPQSYQFMPRLVPANSGVPFTNGIQKISWIDTRDGSENPGYRATIRDGGNASTDLSGYKMEVVMKQPFKHNVYFPYWKRSQEFSGYVVPPTVPSGTANYTSANNAALGKFYSSARNAMTAMQGMTFLGELAQTIHLVKHPGQALFKGIGDYFSQLKKIDRRSSVAYKNSAIASTYLEYVFGWLPLISDSKDALEALDRLANKKVLVNCSGYGEDHKQISSSTSTDLSIYNGTLFPTYTTLVSKSTASVKYYGAVRGTVSGPSIKHTADLFGFRLDEFVPTVWELIPWSFVVDYFTNVGEIVSATFYCNANLARCSKTNRFVVKNECVSTYDHGKMVLSAGSNADGATGTLSSSAYWTTQSTSFQRIKQVNPGVPSLEFSLPGAKQFVNLAALALQMKSTLGHFH